MPVPPRKTIPAAVLRKTLLDWYDAHCRDLPWRSPPSAPPQPAYRVWLSEIMLQQTTVTAVIPYFLKFLKKWPRIENLAAADREDVLEAWAGLGYYARARNLHQCARTVMENYGGDFPADEAELRKLPGIGPYTAAAIASIAFDIPAAAVDGNVERVIARYHGLKTPLRDNKKFLKSEAEKLVFAGKARAGDFTQSLMELGATLCTPKNPQCGRCPWQGGCVAHLNGIAADLPVPPPKTVKPVRYGTVFVLFCPEKKTVFLQKRPDDGLLGGMTEFPSTPWNETPPKTGKDIKKYLPQTVKTAEWQVLPEEIVHHFTHFTLRLSVWQGCGTESSAENRQSWVPAAEVEQRALPGVMQKVWRAALESFKRK